MKTEQQVRDTIIRLAQRAAGVSPRELRDSFAPESRQVLYAVLAKMEAGGEVMEALRPTPSAGRPARRLFTERGAGQAWSAGLVQPQHIAKPAKPAAASKKAIRLDASAPADDSRAKRLEPVAFVDKRAVTLPPGYRSALNPAECRPWANVAAQARAAA